MVEGYLREVLQAAFPQLLWTENTYDQDDNTGTVYVEGGGDPDTYESGLMFPEYMVWIRSSNYDLAQMVAEQTQYLINKRRQIEYTKTLEGVTDTFQIIFIESIGNANRIGLNEGKMEWSVNFRATIRRK